MQSASAAAPGGGFEPAAVIDFVINLTDTLVLRVCINDVGAVGLSKRERD
ncbi:hypothetical protein ROE7235_01446 [Roseibaca ekhonensis]|jgi:hypothetical protein|uniref:Uncharacterized protein n=1 Tax=Roseinatronobacter ekhonensis TaxID=254356 RepID=A0A3B0MV57_9RHOB|nr:hypothetical protein ROE7235_01446 [Roseibaca ekhonensis]